MRQWPCDCTRSAVSPKAAARSAMMSVCPPSARTSRVPRSAWQCLRPRAASHRVAHPRAGSRAGSPSRHAARRGPSAADRAPPARVVGQRKPTRIGCASNSISMPSVLSISRPRQARSRSRATRSCAAPSAAAAASPSASASWVLSTTSVSSRARTWFMRWVCRKHPSASRPCALCRSRLRPAAGVSLPSVRWRRCAIISGRRNLCAGWRRPLEGERRPINRRTRPGAWPAGPHRFICSGLPISAACSWLSASRMALASASALRSSRRFAARTAFGLRAAISRASASASATGRRRRAWPGRAAVLRRR